HLLITEIEKCFAIEPDANSARDIRLAGLVNAIEMFEMISEVRQCLADRTAKQLPSFEELLISGIDELEHMLQPPQNANGSRRLHEDFVKRGSLLQGLHLRYFERYAYGLPGFDQARSAVIALSTCHSEPRTAREWTAPSA